MNSDYIGFYVFYFILYYFAFLMRFAKCKEPTTPPSENPQNSEITFLTLIFVIPFFFFAFLLFSKIHLLFLVVWGFLYIGFALFVSYIFVMYINNNNNGNNNNNQTNNHSPYPSTCVKSTFHIFIYPLILAAMFLGLTFIFHVVDYTLITRKLPQVTFRPEIWVTLGNFLTFLTLIR
jgi:hypothetical protein